MNGTAPAPAKHRRLTPARVARGVLCLTIILSTAFMTLVFWAPPVAGLLRLVSVNLSRKLTSFLFGMWLALWPFLFEKINGTKVVFSGDKVPAKERVLLIANHRTEVDWMYLWDLAVRKGRLGFLKYVLKSSLMKLPVFGWGFHVFEFVSVERKWEVDQPEMRKMLAGFADPTYPLWLAVFPEGTDYTEQKCIRSKKFALENDLPVLHNVLLPKTKGFYSCVEALRNSLDAVYDITIAYKPRCPSFMDNVFGVDPAEVHMHIRRILLDEIPADEEEASSWLMNTFLFKDKLLSDFLTNGNFPHQGTEGELSTIKCLLNFFIVVTATGFCTYLTVFSYFFRLYMFLSCLYLAIITRLKFWPSPICSGSFFCKRKSV